MYYVLGYRLHQCDDLANKHQQDQLDSTNSTFVLALDGDVDFDANAVLSLVELMRKSPKTGAACGRIHPSGSGMVTIEKHNSCLLLITYKDPNCKVISISYKFLVRTVGVVSEV